MTAYIEKGPGSGGEKMPTARDFENVEFGGPAVYRIVVKGRVGGN